MGDSGARRERLLWEGHRERLRRRMEREGWDALKPHEMVELVLFHAVPRQDVSDLARLLVDRFGSVGGVFAATPGQLAEVPGMTEALAEWIGLTGRLMRAYYDLHGQRDIRLGCYQDVRAFLAPRMGLSDAAGLWALYADYDFSLITYAELRGGAAWWDAANARRLMMEAIGSGARYVYLVRWLDGAPSGMEPEETARLEAIAASLRAAEIDLVDCVLAGGGELYSVNVNGGMNAIRAASGCLELHERYDRPAASGEYADP